MDYKELTSNNKRSKIVEINNKKTVAKRTFLFCTTFGYNSVGSEILYDNFRQALTKEEKWINKQGEEK